MWWWPPGKTSWSTNTGTTWLSLSGREEPNITTQLWLFRPLVKNNNLTLIKRWWDKCPAQRYSLWSVSVHCDLCVLCPTHLVNCPSVWPLPLAETPPLLYCTVLWSEGSKPADSPGHTEGLTRVCVNSWGVHVCLTSVCVKIRTWHVIHLDVMLLRGAALPPLCPW